MSGANSYDKNLDSKIVELLLRPDSNNDAATRTIRVDLRCTTGRVGSEDYTFTFGIKRGYLEIVLDGVKEVPNSRLNDAPAPNTGVNATLNAGKDFNAERTVKGGVSVSSADPTNLLGLNAGVAGNMIASNSKRESIEKSSTWVDTPILARPGLLWEVRNNHIGSSSDILDNTYLKSDQLLMVSLIEGANRHAYSVRFFSLIDDLEIIEAKASSLTSRAKMELSRNQTLLRDIILKKSIAEGFDLTSFDDDADQITYSISFQELEGSHEDDTSQH